MTIGYNNLSPFYNQVKRLILGDRKIGHGRSETYLPSETDLCELYGVSRIALSRAISELFLEGYLKWVRGKGTLVTEPTLQQTLISLNRLRNPSQGSAIASAIATWRKAIAHCSKA